MQWFFFGCAVLTGIAAALFLYTGKAFSNFRLYDRDAQPFMYWGSVVGCMVCTVLLVILAFALR